MAHRSRFGSRVIDGRVHVLEVSITDMRHEPEVDGVVLNLRDVTERKTLEEDLRHQTLHDDLTGLANRVLLADRVRDAVQSPSARQKWWVCCSSTSTTSSSSTIRWATYWGRAPGVVADRIQRCLRLSDVAARLGGDEFAVLLTGVYGEIRSLEIAERIREAVSTPIALADNEFRLSEASASRSTPTAHMPTTISFGPLISRCSTPNRMARTATSSSRSTWVRPRSRSSRSRTRSPSDRERRVRPALPADRRHGHEPVRGVEALIRWEDPDRGMVSPASFIPIAEETGLIRPIGMWVAKQALRTLAIWRRQASTSTAASTSQVDRLIRRGLRLTVHRSSRSIGIDLSAIVIELTESVLAAEGVNEIFEQFHDVGFRIALDDFGTGYSAFQYLQNFDIDLIKIDRSFVKAMSTTAMLVWSRPCSTWPRASAPDGRRRHRRHC